MLCMKLVGCFSNLLRICHSRGLYSCELARVETRTATRARLAAADAVNEAQMKEQAIFWGCEEYFAQIFPNLPEKHFCTNFPSTNFLQLLVHYIFLNHVAIHTSLFRWQINSTVTEVYKKRYKLIKLYILQARSQVSRLGGGQNAIQRA